MSNDIRTALEITQDEQSIISEFVSTKEKELNRITIHVCTDAKPCIKCRCLWCTKDLSLIDLKALNRYLHNECYYKVIKEWIP